jgi:putative isomerase
MEQYDVGMTSLLIATFSSLLRVANLTGIGRQHTAVLTERLAQLSAAAASVLWDAELGLYVNVMARSGLFSQRLSPTSFFPMLSGLPSVAQAEEMTLRHLRNDSEFCVSASCSGLPLPSIARSDPAFDDEEYWRGRHWAPHAMIVYWGLADTAYSSSAVVRAVRLQLVSQTSALYREEWRLYRHLHENYNGDSGLGCDRVTSEPLYSWAALNPLMAVLEWRKQRAEIVVEASLA